MVLSLLALLLVIFGVGETFSQGSGGGWQEAGLEWREREIQQQIEEIRERLSKTKKTPGRRPEKIVPIAVPAADVPEPPAAAPPAVEASETVTTRDETTREKHSTEVLQEKLKAIWGRVKGEQEPPARKPEKVAAPSVQEKEAPEISPAVEEGVTEEPVEEPRVSVRRINFSGNSMFDAEVLREAAGLRPGREFSLAGLESMAARVARYYNDQGYFLTQVVVPKQQIRDGVLTLLVLEGRLDEIIVTGHKRYGEKYIRRAFSALQPGQPIRKRSLERALLILNDTSGIEAASRLKAGASTGTTKLVIEVLEKNRAESSLEFNNFGTKSSGRQRIAPRIDWPNVSGRGDSLGLSAVTAPNVDDLLFGQLSYGTPLGTEGYQLKAYVSGGRFEVSQEFAVLDIKGDSFSWGLGVSYPHYLSRGKSVTYEAWLEFNDSEHSLLGTTTSKDQISKLRIGLNHDKRDRKGRNFFSFNVHHGLGENLGGMPDEDTLSSRSFSLADNRFTKFTFDFTRVEGTNPRLFHLARFSGQVSTESLVSGEQWAIGGANSVRGHLQSTYLGDHGYTINLETRLALSRDDSNRCQLVLFADHGMVRVKKPTTGQEDRQRLSGIGLGVRANLPQSGVLRFDLGFPLGPDSGKSVAPYIQLNKRF